MMRRYTGLLLSLPAMILLSLLFLYPIFFNFHMSLYKLNLYVSPERYFVGFDNYIRVVSDPVFWNAFKNTAVFTVFSVLIEFVLGFFLALLLSRIRERWINILTTVCLIPMFLSEVTEGLIGQFMFATRIGLFNVLIQRLFNMQIPFLSDKTLALWSIILVDAWKMFPYFLVIFLAAIISIPRELVEAMSLDGATQWQQVRYLIIPYMIPVFCIAVLIRAIDAFTKVFGVVWMMTGGGPGLATDVIPLRIFNLALRAFTWGIAATWGVFAFLVSLVLVGVYVYVSRRWSS